MRVNTEPRKANPDPAPGTRFSWAKDGPVRTVDKVDKRNGHVWFKIDGIKRSIFLEYWDYVYVRDEK